MPLRELTVRELLRELANQEDMDAAVYMQIGDGELTRINSVDQDDGGTVVISDTE